MCGRSEEWNFGLVDIWRWALLEPDLQGERSAKARSCFPWRVGACFKSLSIRKGYFSYSCSARWCLALSWLGDWIKQSLNPGFNYV